MEKIEGNLLIASARANENDRPFVSRLTQFVNYSFLQGLGFLVYSLDDIQTPWSRKQPFEEGAKPGRDEFMHK